MEFDRAPEGDEVRSPGGEAVYLNTAEMAAKLGVSASTVGRYHSEFAAYLSPYAPPGGGRGLRPEAVAVLRKIREMKSRRASWIEIKQVLEAEFGTGEAPGEPLDTRSFRRSLEAIRQAQHVMANEIHLLLREINRRLDQLEKGVRRTRPAEKALRERKEKRKKAPAAPQPGSLFPNKDKPEEREA